MGFRDLFTPRTKRQKKAKGKGEQLGRAIGELSVSAQDFTVSRLDTITPRTYGKSPVSSVPAVKTRPAIQPRPAAKPRSYDRPSYSGYDHSAAIAATAVSSSSYSSPSYSSCDSSSSSSFSSDAGCSF
ncbi:hypothetical protein SEA_SEPHIROTH_101 [Gordonia Phage Sephiroth]|uniref:Uncharacterized protein n=1 Tax=Gordonia Phage Sephiroth TaxID=2767553 RepID=A0A7G9UZI1_9CAUD|nr:hypothetical protein L3Y23_gp129 [Gordonia Phage Sephiroth]QNN99436.1 hypothetical protein SEA_SEPHIROTH_101 [Gordonia Phage Sephiroth]